MPFWHAAIPSATPVWGLRRPKPPGAPTRFPLSAHPCAPVTHLRVLRKPLSLRRYTQADLSIYALPQFGNFLSRTSGSGRLHHGAAIDHRGGVFGALVENDR